MQPASYKYLSDVALSPQTIWQWAKSLVQSLTQRDAQLVNYSVYVGMSVTKRTTTTPTGWLLENGASYATATHPALFAVIGYTYGGAGANFNVPNTGSTTYIKY